MKANTQQFRQRRRFIMVLPLLVTPFLTMIFWALGGGQGTATYGMETKKAGLNLELPNAQFEEGKNDWDKLSLYQKAQRDSIKYNEAKRNDPYFRLPAMEGSQDTSRRPGNVNTSLGKKDRSIDENEELVNKKLAELYKNLNPSSETERKTKYETEVPQVGNSTISGDVEKLEAMMEMMQSRGAEDEEMKEIQSVLDKILDVQHPERVKARLKEQSDSTSTNKYQVSAATDNAVSLIQQRHEVEDEHTTISNQFYGLQETGTVSGSPKAFEAEVYDAQTLVSGSVIKLKLLNDIYVNGILIPRNHFVFGVCALSGERLTVNVSSIHYRNEIFPVSLSVFDLDGLDGIYIPGAIARDVAKQSSNQAIQDIQLNSMNPSLEIQAANAGIETAKNLISKKTRLIKVTVKSGYKVLLIDTSSKNH
jgi:conjugative transposon TraM protein